MRIKRKIEDQAKIQKALEEDDIHALWKEVMYIGYDRIPSVAERKLIFLRTYQEYDPEVNDNFVAYYDRCIHWTRLLNWQKVTNHLNISDANKRRVETQNLWPDPDNLFPEPKNQQENVLNNFIV